MADNVNHPSHYETGKFECIEVMLETQGIEAVKNFCICNAFKYLYLHCGKNGLEDVKKAPKSEGLHILWMHMMPFLQEPVKDIFNYSDQIHISACDFVADGFQKTHYEDPYESMAEKMVNCIYNGSVRQRIQKAKELAAQTNVDGGILFTHWGCKGTIGASSLIKGSLEEAGIPTMILDGDGCNPANSSDGQISTRLQAYMEMLKVNKAEKYAANHGKGAGSDDTLCL